MQTIDRAMQVIKVLSKNDTRMWISITDLSKECDLPVSTLHRLLQSMKQRRAYSAGPRFEIIFHG